VHHPLPGKRGNIVQTYPAVEYDFLPDRLTASPADLIHIQWTGSNTHNNGGGGGDGQAGDAGQGTTGTDRHNFVQLAALEENYPIPLVRPHAHAPRPGGPAHHHHARLTLGFFAPPCLCAAARLMRRTR
jgi:hypothetical protein